jgi:hypothetical protein
MRTEVEGGAVAQELAVHVLEKAARVEEEDGDGADEGIESLLVDGLGTIEPPEAGDAEDESDQSW